jgi:hypothetical protein
MDKQRLLCLTLKYKRLTKDKERLLTLLSNIGLGWKDYGDKQTSLALKCLNSFKRLAGDTQRSHPQISDWAVKDRD